MTPEPSPPKQAWASGIAYAGTAYCGWQFQHHCPSVQGALQKALSSVANEPVALHCAGRTDAGVHALAQVAHFETQADRPTKAWVQGVNTQLPSDIRVQWAQPVPPDFHARFSAHARSYRYVIHNRAVASAHFADRMTWVRETLDAQCMHQAAQSVLGEHDFSAFRAAGCQAKHAWRAVQSLDVSRQGHLVMVDVRANAFLHHMVRNLVGSLIVIGHHQRPVSWLATLLAQKDRTLAAKTAPAQGLYFVNAHYPKPYGLPEAALDCALWACE